jgi:hypothetical protein
MPVGRTQPMYQLSRMNRNTATDKRHAHGASARAMRGRGSSPGSRPLRSMKRPALASAPSTATSIMTITDFHAVSDYQPRRRGLQGRAHEGAALHRAAGCRAAAAAGTARLGVWQLDRAAQKTRCSRRSTSAASCRRCRWRAGARCPTAAEQHHRAIELRAAGCPTATVYLENRQMNGRPGFYVVTPLLLADGTAVVVQRGWCRAT